MKFRSCDAVHRPDLRGAAFRLSEGEYFISEVNDHGYHYQMMFCKLPDVMYPRGLPLNADKEQISYKAIWTWNENIESPTLNPSILVGEESDPVWHGHLVDGKFIACE